MELHYYKNIEEAEEYLTWEFVKYDLTHYGDVLTTIEQGWTKKQVPTFTNDLEAACWYSASNAEDRHFIMMEKLYCNIYLNKELKDIENSQPNNEKIIENCKLKRNL